MQMAINGTILALFYTSFFVSPLCVGYVWVKRLRARNPDAPHYGWRDFLLLGAQLMVTAAVVLVWYWLLNHSSLSTPQEDRYLWSMLRASSGLAAFAFVGALVGTGAAKKFTVVSSVLVFINWLAVGVFQ